MVQGGFRGVGSLAGVGGRWAVIGHGSGYWAASEGPYSGTSPKDGQGGNGLVGGTGAGLGSGIAGRQVDGVAQDGPESGPGSAKSSGSL